MIGFLMRPLHLHQKINHHRIRATTGRAAAFVGAWLLSVNLSFGAEPSKTTDRVRIRSKNTSAASRVYPPGAALAKDEEPANQDQLSKQITTLSKSLSADPDNRTLRRQLGVLYTQSIADFDRAKPIFEALVKEHEDTDSLMDLASCYYRTDYDETFKLCSKAAQRADGKEYTTAMVELSLGGSCYRRNDLKEAERHYQQSLKALTDRDLFLVAKLDLAGLAGVYWRLKDYAKSASMYEALYRLDRDAYGANDIECGWALLQESQALDKNGSHAKADRCWTRAIYLFRKCNADRLVEEYKDSHKGVVAADIAERINRTTFGSAFDKPAPDPFKPGHSVYTDRLSFDLRGFISPWKRQFKQTEAPGWVWLDPEVPPKALLICVHGLGLHHRAYESFAQRIKKEGIITIAFDVRGFGTYVEANGQDRLDMRGCLDDLKKVLAVLRRDYHDYPLFLLGESMGGALALRVVAEAPQVVDGLICSVPSGSRYKSLATKLRVGADFIKNSRKPVPIGLSVVKQATTDEQLRKKWIQDPASRLMLSPRELIAFQRFMDENIEYARKITAKPVILFQGHDDKLVREKGTLDLFEALSTPEKSIVIIGNTEHLIFEAGQFKDDLTLGVLGWMAAHSHSRQSR